MNNPSGNVNNTPGARFPQNNMQPKEPQIYHLVKGVKVKGVKVQGVKEKGVMGRPLLTQVPLQAPQPTPKAKPKSLIPTKPPQQTNAPRVTGAGWPMTMQFNVNKPTTGIPKTMIPQQNVANLAIAVEDTQDVPQPYSPSDVYDADDAGNNQDTQDVPQPYSPSDVYDADDAGNNQDPDNDSEDNSNHSGQKRMSAFQRLGPVTQPKKPKLTINLTLNKEQSVREVVDETEEDQEKYGPVHLRQDILTSTDDTVMKYLTFWPWRKNIVTKRNVSARNSKSVMILEQEQMEELYEKDNLFFQISVKGFPATWTKEDVMDTILEHVKTCSFIPCFTEFNKRECKFLCMRSRPAMLLIHKTGFIIHKDGVELCIVISSTSLTLNQIDFIPRLILRKRLALVYTELSLDLSYFTLKEDVSHFLYFPLNRISNQAELVQLQSIVDWSHLTSLNLSRNRITDITGFDLKHSTPRLKYLDLSHNYIERITALLYCKGLPLKSIRLEGNPLCTDYTDPDHYIKVLRMLFPCVKEIDGELIVLKGDLPTIKQNYCPNEDSQLIAEKFLERYFPVMDNDRDLIQGMYDKHATLNITYSHKLRCSTTIRTFSNLFLFARSGLMDDGERDPIDGDSNIAKLIKKWPKSEHDPLTFTVDVVFHNENTTILHIGGILKLVAETLAEDEEQISFNRTVVLHTTDGVLYKIHNEMLYWDLPSASYARTAFRRTTIKTKQLKVESTNDDELKEEYLKIFMKLTTMDKKLSERCLELKSWHLKEALEYFTKQLRLDNLDAIMTEA